MTDVSDHGMHYVASLSGLTEFVIRGGRPGIGNDGLALLKRTQRLKTVELTNTHVTSDGLRVLVDFPALRRLKLHYEAFRGSSLTDDALESLRSLENLNRLELIGGWASDSMIVALREALPTCDIVVEGAHQRRQVNP